MLFVCASNLCEVKASRRKAYTSISYEKECSKTPWFFTQECIKLNAKLKTKQNKKKTQNILINAK